MGDRRRGGDQVPDAVAGAPLGLIAVADVVRPEAPASTMKFSREKGTESRASGQVSAQGQGFTSFPPRTVPVHARRKSTCATRALP